MLETLGQKPPQPENEQERLAELRAYEILDTEAEAAFDRLTQMAARHFGMPIALVSLVDHDRQWFKSHLGLDALETSRDLAFCAYAILQNEVMVVPDACADPRFAENPLVTGNPDIRFYAGAPLTTKNGHNMGTLCLIDRVPHPVFTEEQKKELADLASIAIDEMELRLSLKWAKQDIHALEDAQKRAEQSTHEKSQFVATISHELRTPMNGILGMAYLLNDTPLDALKREYVDTINHSAQNLLLLINDVLDLSKIEAGELMLDKAPFDIKNCFLQTLKLLTPLAGKKGNTLLPCIHSTIPEIVIGDQGRFAQIVTNLVGNAVKFTENGKVEAGLLYSPNDHSIHCEIIDTGIGIPANNHAMIFEGFTQGDPTITQKYGGTGLGLAITKHLVIMLGGEIGFESQEKIGSRFWFKLPVLLPNAPALCASNEISSDAQTGRINVCRARVLIAEDHPINQMFLIALLKKFGFIQIDVAENGIKAIEKIQHNKTPYDVIFMDCKMPEQDGYQTTKIIRAQEHQERNTSPIPIIAMTANALAGDREACFDVGMNDYISKPLQPEKLKETLKTWFVFDGNKHEAHAPAAPNTLPPINLARLDMVADTEQEKATILSIFFTLAGGIISAMEEAKRSEDFLRWKDAAHSLKGSAANLGMGDLEKLCGLSEQASYLTCDQRSVLLRRIENEIGRVKTYISQQQQTTRV